MIRKNVACLSTTATTPIKMGLWSNGKGRSVFERSTIPPRTDPKRLPPHHIFFTAINGPKTNTYSITRPIMNAAFPHPEQKPRQYSSIDKIIPRPLNVSQTILRQIKYIFFTAINGLNYNYYAIFPRSSYFNELIFVPRSDN